MVVVVVVVVVRTSIFIYLKNAILKKERENSHSFGDHVVSRDEFICGCFQYPRYFNAIYEYLRLLTPLHVPPLQRQLSANPYINLGAAIQTGAQRLLLSDCS